MATNIYGNPTSVGIKKTITNAGWEKLVGLQYPLHASLGKGFFSRESNVPLIKNNIKQLLQTERGERVMLPSYGVSLRRFLFQQLDEILFSEIREEVLYSLNRYVPGIEVSKIRVSELGTENGIAIALDIKLKEDSDLNFDIGVEIK